MRTWQGLGYYSRARNLHHTAKLISKEFKGKFPCEYEAIKELKGIGEYTAAAIASFAFNKPHAVVDGNVFRVLSRYLGIRTPIDSTEGKKVFTEKANLLLDKKDPGTFNQAIMEFGALQCVPQNPDCGKCPLKKSCKALAKDEVEMLPVKAQKTKVRTRYFNYFVIRKNGKTLIRKRTANDIWKDLYDFPMQETKRATGRSTEKSFKHVLSHQIIHARFFELSSSRSLLKKDVETEGGNFMYVSDNQLNKYAFPRLIQRYFEEK
jgi:A/G-specific adenine glycosylase